jgi:hypothetical protein
MKVLAGRRDTVSVKVCVLTPDLFLAVRVIV